MIEFNDWLIKHFIVIKGTDDEAKSKDQNHSVIISGEVNEIEENQEEKTPLEDLKELLTLKMKNAIEKGADIDVSLVIYDEMVKFILNHLEIIQSREKITLKEITEIYLRTLYDIGEIENNTISKFDPYQQFSPLTLKYLSNLIARENELLDFMSIEYWKGKVFRNISKVEGNKNLLFSVRSFIGFLNLIDNKNKRLYDLKN